MKVRYFAETDTLHLELSARPPAETRELSSNLLVDYDSAGKVVGLTIEHASLEASAPDFSYQLIKSGKDVSSRSR